MSRAFVKEDSDTEAVVVPARAPLPDGVANLVTPAGKDALERERAALEAELERVRGAADETRAVASIDGQLEELRARLASAQVVSLPEGTLEEVSVGTSVILRRGDGRTLRLRIVGVDEADPASGSVAFTAPVAAAALGRRVGESFAAPIGDAEVRFEVLAIER
jgi:transcription elongation factor GreB